MLEEGERSTQDAKNTAIDAKPRRVSTFKKIVGAGALFLLLCSMFLLILNTSEESLSQEKPIHKLDIVSPDSIPIAPTKSIEPTSTAEVVEQVKPKYATLAHFVEKVNAHQRIAIGISFGLALVITAAIVLGVLFGPRHVSDVPQTPSVDPVDDDIEKAVTPNGGIPVLAIVIPVIFFFILGVCVFVVWSRCCGLLGTQKIDTEETQAVNLIFDTSDVSLTTGDTPNDPDRASLLNEVKKAIFTLNGLAIFHTPMNVQDIKVDVGKPPLSKRVSVPANFLIDMYFKGLFEGKEQDLTNFIILDKALGILVTDPQSNAIYVAYSCRDYINHLENEIGINVEDVLTIILNLQEVFKGST